MGRYIERLDFTDPVYGYDYNRIVDALTNNRPASTVAMMESYIVPGGLQSLVASTGYLWRWVVPPTQIDTIIKVYLHFAFDAGSLSIQIDGTDRTSALGGPFAAGNYTGKDISSYVTTTGWHTITWTDTANAALFPYLQFQTLFNGSV